MFVLKGSRQLPLIVVHETGEEVICRIMSDGDLIEMVSAAADIAFATEQGRPIPAAARALIGVLSGYHDETRQPRFREDDCDAVDEAISDATTLLRTAGRIAVAGSAVRPGPDGPEAIALVLFVDQSIAACRAQVDLSAAGAEMA